MLMTANTLTSVRFLLNKQKSYPIPTKRIQALDYIIDSAEITATLPQHKTINVIASCKKLLSKRFHKIRTVAQTLGKIIACFLVLHLGRAYYCSLEHDKLRGLKLNNFNYTRKCKQSNESQQELQWWLHNLTYAVLKIDKGQIDLELFVDASKLGWGSVLPPNNCPSLMISR